jgi:glycine hydroxymethyltransferase
MNPSGVRFGTPAVTTRGMKEPEITKIAGFIDSAIRGRSDDNKLNGIKASVREMCLKFPIPSI